jgi:hypothetical protein
MVHFLVEPSKWGQVRKDGRQTWRDLSLGDSRIAQTIAWRAKRKQLKLRGFDLLLMEDGSLYKSA